MAEDTVVPFNGKDLSQADMRQRNDALVVQVEGLLERAKAGEVVGIMGAVTFHDKSVSQITFGSMSIAQLGSVHLLAAHMTAVLKD